MVRRQNLLTRYGVEIPSSPQDRTVRWSHDGRRGMSVRPCDGYFHTCAHIFSGFGDAALPRPARAATTCSVPFYLTEESIGCRIKRPSSRGRRPGDPLQTEFVAGRVLTRPVCVVELALPLVRPPGHHHLMPSYRCRTSRTITG